VSPTLCLLLCLPHCASHCVSHYCVSLTVSPSLCLSAELLSPARRRQVLRLILDAVARMPPIERALVRVSLCEHPRQTSEERRLSGGVLREAPPGLLLAPVIGDSDSMVPGADVVVSGYSTTNYYAILWGVPAVVYAATPKVAARYYSDEKVANRDIRVWHGATETGP
jgi:hypothetical protein